MVYESMFGNTKAVAEAVADGVSTGLSVELVDVREAPSRLDEETLLLIVGGPTHAFGMSRAATRKDAAKYGEGPGVGAERGVRDWLATLPAVGVGKRAAAFSTIVAQPSWLHRVGSATRGIRAGLRRAGFRSDSGCEFLVEGITGPLLPGELERARRWGVELASPIPVPTDGVQQLRARARRSLLAEGHSRKAR